MRKLSDIMEFDHVIQVHEDGSITEPKGIYAPTLFDEQLDDSEWGLLKGYTGQDSYHGPIMHNSEFIGGRLERDILGTPGFYVAIVAFWSPEEDVEDDPDGDMDTIEGWAVAYRPAEVAE